MRLREPLTSHDLVAMAAPVTKWSAQVEEVGELPLALNRAFKLAQDPPPGPVFLSLPMNVLAADTELEPMPPSLVARRSAPDPSAVAEAAGLMLAAQRPLIVSGDMVSRSGAMAQLVELAEFLGAEVYGEILPAHLSFPNRHPLYRGRMPFDQGAIRTRLEGSDLVLLIGGEFFDELWFVDVPILPEGARLVQIDAAAANVGKNYRVDCGIVADPSLALAALLQELEQRADDAFHQAVRERLLEARTRETSSSASMEGEPAGLPMSPARFVTEIARGLPPDAVLTFESPSLTEELFRGLAFRRAGDHLASRGAGIGQAIPSAIEVKLALPERPVLALSGDGSALYTVQALWTAARQRVPVLTVIANNRSYVNLGLGRYRTFYPSPAGAPAIPEFDLAEPAVDFVALARGFGVDGRRIDDPAELAPALEAGLASGRPCLLEVAIAATSAGEAIASAAAPREA
jgi:benzoylformate decarboxylase